MRNTFKTGITVCSFILVSGLLVACGSSSGDDSTLAEYETSELIEYTEEDSEGNTDEIEEESEEIEEGDNDSADESEETEGSTKKKSSTKDSSDSDSSVDNISYADNETVDLDACNDADSFESVAADDGSFTFTYPKSMFNYVESDMEGLNGYTLAYLDEEEDAVPYQLSVYSQDDEGDALENVKTMFSEFESVMDTYDEVKVPTESNGSARGILTGTYDGQSLYIIVSNDGKKDYVLMFTYTKPSSSDDQEKIGYIIESIYRGCSFSGSTKEIRTFEEYQADN